MQVMILDGATIPAGTYYRLSTEDLKDLGFSETESTDEYIVSYEHGVVMNYTKKKTAEGEYLIKN